MNWLNFCCIQCQQTLAFAHHGICCRCNKLIQRTPYCGTCGSVLVENNLICGHCIQHKPNWDQMVIIGKYQPPLSDYIHRFKFHRQFWLDRSLARLLFLAIRQAKRTHGLILPQAIIPVPLHHFRQWYRGYNQADLIARYLSHYLQLPIIYHWVKRSKHTPSQRGLTAKERRKNIKNAFSITPQPQLYQSVALVDDVITTGSTLNEIAHLLRQQGVQHIQVWGLCKT